MPNKRQIYANSTEYADITVTGDHDLSLDTIEIFIASSRVRSLPADTVWLNPDRISHPTTDQVRAELLVGPEGGTLTLAPGQYRVWAKLTDSPEVPWLRSADILVIV